MTRESKFRLRWIVALGSIGYLIPVITGFVPQAPAIPVPLSVLRVLVPIVNLTAQYPVDPDWSAVLFFIGPINCLLYALIGLIVSQVLINRWRPQD